MSEKDEPISFNAKEKQDKIIIHLDPDNIEKAPQEKELVEATNQDSAPPQRSLARILSYDIIKVILHFVNL